MKPISFSDKYNTLNVAVSSIEEDTILQQKASTLADVLHIPLVPSSEQEKHTLLLLYTEKGLQIQLKHDSKAKRPVLLYVDFLSDSLTYRRQHGGGIKQALAKAVGIKPGIRPTILDATAGLGKDSFLLASLGCKVCMIERSPLLAALLQDALERGAHSAELQQTVLTNLTLIQGDTNSLITHQQNSADTVYLDPMYPHNRKSALNRQEMRIIRILVGDDSDADILLHTALRHAKKRVVVKRPKGAPTLSSLAPSHVITMKNSRYDVYMI